MMISPLKTEINRRHISGFSFHVTERALFFSLRNNCREIIAHYYKKRCITCAECDLDVSILEKICNIFITEL